MKKVITPDWTSTYPTDSIMKVFDGLQYCGPGWYLSDNDTLHIEAEGKHLVVRCWNCNIKDILQFSTNDVRQDARTITK